MRWIPVLLAVATFPTTALAASTVFEAALVPASPRAGEPASIRISNRPESGCPTSRPLIATRVAGGAFVVEVEIGDACQDEEFPPVTIPLGAWPAGVSTVSVVESSVGPDGITIGDTILLRPVDATLVVRQRSFRRFDAVVTGIIGNECGPYVVAPQSVAREGQQIRLSTPGLAWGACFQASDRQYSVVAQLGELAVGEHEVVWQQDGFFDVSVRFEVSPDAVFFEGFE